MRTRLFPFAAVALACALVLVGASCSGDDDSAPTTTTEALPEPTTTVSAEEFDAGVAEIRAELDAASDDACPIVSIVTTAGSDIGTRDDPAAVEQLVNLQADVLRALADTRQVAAAGAGTGDVLREAADQLVAEAEASDYSLESLQGSAILQDPAVTQAFGVIQQIGSDCQAAAPGTDPTATPLP
jgi:hypothetical protein